MNQSLEALMGSIRRALQDEILPELESDHARSQMAGVLDVLGKIESMVVWSPDVTREQLDLFEACLAQAATLVSTTMTCHPGLDPGSIPPGSNASSAPPWIPDQVRDDSEKVALTQEALHAALADAEQRFALLTDWLFRPPAWLPAPLLDELHDLQRTTLRNTLRAQRRLVPSADFSSMTAPRTSVGAQGDSP